MDSHGQQRRRLPRVEMRCTCTLSRSKGSPVTGETIDLGPGGMRIATGRPLALDELLAFDLDLHAERIDGSARVVREQAPNVYALRFEALAPEASGRLERLAAA